MKIKKLVFVDNITGCGKGDADTLYIALKPAAYSYLKKQGANVHSTINYFTNDSHKKALEKSEALMKWIRRELKFKSLDIGVNRAYSDLFSFWMRLEIHYFLWTTEIIRNAAILHKPEIIAAALPGKYASMKLSIESEECYLGTLAQAMARNENIEFENLSKSRIKHAKNFPDIDTRRIKHLIKFILKYVKFYIWQRVLYFRNMNNKKRPVFFATMHYNMHSLANDLKKAIPDRKFYLFTGPILSYTKIPRIFIKMFERRFAKTILGQKELLDGFATKLGKETTLFSSNGISFSSMLSHKIKANITDHIISFYLWTAKLDSCLDIIKPGMVISNGNRSDDIALAELCLRKKIPDILISHGSHVCPKNKYECIEWGEHGVAFLKAPFSSLVLQSPLAEGYIKAFPTQSNIFRSKPILWGKPAEPNIKANLSKELLELKHEKQNVKIIVHAGTPKMSNNLRLYVYETPDEYLEALSDLANTVKSMKETVLIVKFRPSPEISVNNLRERIPFSENVILSVEEPFNAVLEMADVLISFSSTTIEEALQKKIPVLLYGGQGRYKHVSAGSITLGDPVKPEAVYHVENKQDLKYAIKTILGLNINGKNRDNDLFKPYIYPDHETKPLLNLIEKEVG
ncbi:MAG: hypothetical protein HQ549_04575 [Candidatus Omnitrophica bacterium]|nr:hypothetical protein [Candidatus Omnitrophota bacterium]